MKRCFHVAFLALLLLLLASSASAQGGFASGIAWTYTPAGAFPSGGAVVTICSSSGSGAPCTPVVSLFSDSALSHSVSNPLAQCTVSPQVGCIDNLGNFSFYATAGQYTYTITSASGLNTYGPIPIIADSGSGGGGGGSSLVFYGNDSSTSGTPNAYVVTTTQTMASLLPGTIVSWIPQHTSTPTATLDVDGFGAITVVSSIFGHTFTTADLNMSNMAVTIYDGTHWQLMNPSSGGPPISGSIAATQVAYGSGSNVIAGDAGFTYAQPTTTVKIGSSTTNVQIYPNTDTTSPQIDFYSPTSLGHGQLFYQDPDIFQIRTSNGNGAINIFDATSEVRFRGVGGIFMDDNLFMEAPGGGLGGTIYYQGGTDGQAALGAAANAGFPATLFLPKTTGVALQPLVSDGNTPQQSSWSPIINLNSLQLNEGSAPPGISATDVFWADSVKHWPAFIPNAGSTYYPLGILSTGGTPGQCAQFVSTYVIQTSGAGCGSGGAGTVTSVAQSFTGGLISVAGSPITTSGTLALTVAGTSGGIPCFSSTSTWTSSALLTANLPLIGGGAGVCPSVGTVSGNTTEFGTVTGSLTSGHGLKSDASGNIIDSGAVPGTVTSAGTSFTGGLISVAGSPVTTSGTAALTVAGTSGGVPYFASSSTWASSGALTANLPVIGGGAGSAPTVGTRSGNTTKYVTTTGTLTNGDCVSIDAGGNMIDSGQVGCGGGGAGGTVTSVALAAPTGFGVSGSPVVTSGTLTLAMPTSWTTGDVLLGNGSNSVARLPIGTNLQVLQSNGTTASWQTILNGGTVTNFSANNITTASQNFATQGVTSPGTTPVLSYTLANSPAHTVFANCTAGSGAPDYVALTEACLPAATVFTDVSATFGAHTYSFLGSTLTTLRASAGLTTSTNGDLGYDTTNKNWHIWENAGDRFLPVFSTTPTNGQCVTVGVATSVITLVPGACTSGITLQTNTVNNSSQTTLNMVSSSSGANSVTMTNTSGGIVQATITNAAGGGNAVLDGTLTGFAQGNVLCGDATPKIVNCIPSTVPNEQVGTSYTILSTDSQKFLTFTNSAATAVSVPVTFGLGFAFAAVNAGAGAVTLTPISGTICGGATQLLLKGMQGNFVFDGTNYVCTISGYASGTTGAISGIITIGTCDSGTATINGAATTMTASASPVTYPGDGLYWVAYVSAANTVTVKVCATATLTPTSSAYNVRLFP